MGVKAHSARTHSKWSASASARYFACPRAFRLEQSFPSGQTNRAAAWGTACHELAENCLYNSYKPEALKLCTITADGYAFVVDDEMCQTVKVYTDYIREQKALYKKATQKKAVCQFEKNYSLAALTPPVDAGGTADAVIRYFDWDLLEVVDLKTGVGYVSAENNPQLRTYALGAILQTGHIGSVKMTIVQPRAGNDIIRSETLSAAEMVQWTLELLTAMEIAVAEDAPYNPGDEQCRYCKAFATCPAAREKALGEAKLYFSDGKIEGHNNPDSLMPEEIAHILNNADLIQNWLNAVRAYAHSQAESGVVIPGYILVPKRANRSWAADENTTASKLKALGVEPYEQHLISPNKAEKALGKSQKDQIADLWETKAVGTNLVAKTKTTREAQEPLVNRFFSME